MNTMTGKEVLRAIADGADPSEFEVADAVPTEWETLWDEVSVKTLIDAGLSFRRKPRTRVVNGFTVPAPIQEVLKVGIRYFAAMPDLDNWVGEYEWCRSKTDEIWFSRGLLFSTKEAAIANAKAMVGIDPNGDA